MTKKEKATLLKNIMQGKTSIQDLRASETVVRFIWEDADPKRPLYCTETGERWSKQEYADHVKRDNIIHIEL